MIKDNLHIRNRTVTFQDRGLLWEGEFESGSHFTYQDEFIYSSHGFRAQCECHEAQGQEVHFSVEGVDFESGMMRHEDQC